MFCYQCNRFSENVLCSSCAQELYSSSFTSLYHHSCPRCTLPILDSAYACTWCTEQKVSWGVYEGVLARLLAKMKNTNDPPLMHYLAHVLHPLTRGLQIDCIVPTPASFSGRRRRGYDQMVILSKILAKDLGCEVHDLLIQKKRSIEVTGTKTPLPSKHVVLLDDVYTTGSTTDRCKELLNEHYGIIASVITLAQS